MFLCGRGDGADDGAIKQGGGGRQAGRDEVIVSEQTEETGGQEQGHQSSSYTLLFICAFISTATFPLNLRRVPPDQQPPFSGAPQGTHM